MHAVERRTVEPLDQRVQFRLEDAAVDLLPIVEGHAEDFVPLLVGECREILRESRHPVALGDEEVDRDRRHEGLREFVETVAQPLSVLLQLLLAPLHQRIDAEGQDDPVDRPLPALLLEELQKRLPDVGVHRFRLLFDVASGHIDKDRVLGEIPLERLGASRFRHRPPAVVDVQGELQARRLQQGRLSLLFPADHQVPRQFVVRLPLPLVDARIPDDLRRLDEARFQIFDPGFGGLSRLTAPRLQLFFLLQPLLRLLPEVELVEQHPHHRSEKEGDPDKQPQTQLREGLVEVVPEENDHKRPHQCKRQDPEGDAPEPYKSSSLSHLCPLSDTVSAVA